VTDLLERQAGALGDVDDRLSGGHALGLRRQCAGAVVLAAVAQLGDRGAQQCAANTGAPAPRVDVGGGDLGRALASVVVAAGRDRRAEAIHPTLGFDRDEREPASGTLAQQLSPVLLALLER
jgi:hypothetical protein